MCEVSFRLEREKKYVRIFHEYEIITTTRPVRAIRIRSDQ